MVDILVSCVPRVKSDKSSVDAAILKWQWFKGGRCFLTRVTFDRCHAACLTFALVILPAKFTFSFTSFKITSVYLSFRQCEIYFANASNFEHPEREITAFFGIVFGTSAILQILLISRVSLPSPSPRKDNLFLIKK